MVRQEFRPRTAAGEPIAARSAVGRGTFTQVCALPDQLPRGSLPSTPRHGTSHPRGPARHTPPLGTARRPDEPLGPPLTRDRSDPGLAAARADYIWLVMVLWNREIYCGRTPVNISSLAHDFFFKVGTDKFPIPNHIQ